MGVGMGTTSRRRFFGGVVLGVGLLGLAGCDDGGDSTTSDAGADSAVAGDGGSVDAGAAADVTCDPLDPTVCALPWPSNLYLQPDTARETGFTLTFGAETLPKNQAGVSIAPAPYARLDGYGVGVPLMTVFPNLDLTGIAGEWSLAASLDEDAPIVWLEVTDTGVERVPYWAELDVRELDPARRLLFVRPAVLLKENTHYVVGFRELKDTDGAAIAPSTAFASLRDGDTADDPDLAPRQARFDALFEVLAGAGVARDSLVLAWDFNTASGEALSGTLLGMRDDALAATGPSGAELTFTLVEDFAPEEDGSGRPVDAYIGLNIEGTFKAPHFMKAEGPLLGETGWVFNRGPDGRPQQDGWRDARFWLRVPHTALDGTPHGLVQYGHGLLGSGSQTRGGHNSKIAFDHQLIFYGCDMTGMSGADEAPVGAILTDLSYFPWLADRMHQGMVEHVVLARAMRERLGTMMEITDRGIVIDPAQSFYSGISQGGIYGATLMAISPDFTYGHLGVPGQNYSTLLQRSVDFTPFFSVLENIYLGRAEQAVVLSAIQQLWNQTDPVSYYRHLSAEPFPGHAPRYVIAAPARGDYQVAPVTMEVVARSGVGLSVMDHYDDEHPVELVREQSYPYVGSGLVNWHYGNPWATPGENVPPIDDVGDPHGKPRRSDSHNAQMAHFFRTGEIIDVCEGGACPPASERP